MTKEAKELLLKDLCARLTSYTGVLVDYIDESNVNEVLNVYHIIGLKHYTGDDGLINIKPYLRPMSDMTEEEKRRYNNYKYWIEKGDIEHCTINMVDWLIAHYFDYRGLIPIGLALEAPKDMYSI